MSLSAALAIANAGLANISLQFGVVSQNVANLNTPGYAQEIATQTALTAQGDPLGVRSGVITREIDASTQASLMSQNAVVAALQVRQSALKDIDNVQGTVGGSRDLSSLVGALEDAFSTLQSDPSNQTQQQTVVSAAQGLSTQINSLFNAVETARQSTQDGLVSGIATLNQTLGTIGSLSSQIVALRAEGKSTADLESQRDAAVTNLSQLLDVRMIEQPDGHATLLTPSGLDLPIHATSAAFSIAQASTGPTLSYPGGLPGILLNGQDVTAQMQGGQIGANLTLRDQTLPTYQAELDEFSNTLSQRFAAQGLTLFTDANGIVPSSTAAPTQSGYLGYAGTIQVNPGVAATPSLVRDGTNVIAGSTTGASAFTPNPANGPAGFTGLITRILNYTFGTDVQSGVAQPSPAATGLGASGTLSAPVGPVTDLSSFATAIVSAEAQDSADAGTRLTTEQSVQGTLQTTASATGGVSIDQQMSKMIELQNAYGANASG